MGLPFSWAKVTPIKMISFDAAPLKLLNVRNFDQSCFEKILVFSITKIKKN